tara:strand:+ start:430 stop:636 length:207 start_codon:yes stop_codon:yes gene_type:complete
MMINKVTITGKMNTWMKYILVTVRGEREEPAKSRVATYLPISGVELARLIPITAAPYARVSHGRRYPE